MEQPKAEIAHALVFPFPAQGHINPMFQFAVRLVSKHVKVSLVTTIFRYKSLDAKTGAIKVELISDGCDDNGSQQAGSVDNYIERFRTVGRQSLSDLFRSLALSGNPVNCLVYDSLVPWALDVAREFGVFAACFWTQSCSVNSIYYHFHRGTVDLHPSSPTVSLPGLPDFKPSELPSFLSKPDDYPPIRSLLLTQFSNVEEADCVLCNTFDELEREVVMLLNTFLPVKTIGPTVPSFDSRRIEGEVDHDYGINFWKTQNDLCEQWLQARDSGSVVYVSFGSVIVMEPEQMREVAWGLHDTGRHFLWVVRETEMCKLPEDFAPPKGLIVTWCQQPQVLAHSAVGCFLTHCGWNSTLEGLCLGVPIVSFPIWSDQPTNGKFMEDVWRVGVKVRADERGFACRDEIQRCIVEVMDGARCEEIQHNASAWRARALQAIGEGGSSRRNFDAFVEDLVHRARYTSPLD